MIMLGWMLSLVRTSRILLLGPAELERMYRRSVRLVVGASRIMCIRISRRKYMAMGAVIILIR